MAAIVDHVAARDGTPILVRRWPVAQGQAWASLLLVHGLGEHSGRYDHVGEQLAGAGIETQALDLRGFGASGGRRAWVERWSQLHDDVEERLGALRSLAPARPLVLYGHSMGGLVALGYVLDGRSQPDLLVLSAPAIAAEIPAWQRVVARSLARVAPTFAVANRIAGDVLMRDQARQAAYREDPLNVHRTTARFAVQAFDEQARVRAALDRLAIPTLVIHGELDRLVPTASSEALDGRPTVTRRVISGSLHEVHNEPEGPETISGVIDWIRERVSRRHQPVAPASPVAAGSSGPG